MKRLRKHVLSAEFVKFFPKAGVSVIGAGPSRTQVDRQDWTQCRYRIAEKLDFSKINSHVGVQPT